MIKKTEFSNSPKVLSFLLDDILLKILEKVEDKKTWRLVCRDFLKIEAVSRKSIRILRPEVLPRVLGICSGLEHLDLSVCPRLTNEVIYRVRSDLLRSVNLSRATRIDCRGLEALANRCPNLEEIDLSYCCRFSDSEAAALSFAPNLRRVTLVKCLKITDIGLVRIAVGCSKLCLLNLKWCRLITDLGVEFVVTKCKDLTFLDISYLSVTNKCLRSIACANKLEVLTMVGCMMVDDNGLNCLRNRGSSLQKIDVSRCRNISTLGVISFLKGNKRVQELGAGYCLNDFTCQLLSKMTDLKYLTAIRLDAWELYPEFLGNISRNCQCLSEIGLSKCAGVTDEGINNLTEHCKDLRVLDITCCHELTDAALAAIAHSCKNLRCLKMESCGLFTEKGLEKIGADRSFLHELDLTDCSIDDVSLKHISKCRELQILKLGLCIDISDKGIACIGSSCKDLQELDLYRCVGISDDGLAALATGCKKLERINICYCIEITDIGLKHIANLSKLWELEMRGLIRVTCLGMAEMAHGFTSLAQLDIKRCYAITDRAIWALVQNSLNLRQINISYCRISDGALYALFSRLKCLQDVKMVHLTHVSLDGFRLALRASDSVQKIKLLEGLKYLLPLDLIHKLQSRGMQNPLVEQASCTVLRYLPLFSCCIFDISTEENA